jgi:putative ABC transport system ATP-binding protein
VVNTPYIDLKNVSKSYTKGGEKVGVLGNLNLSFPKGCFAALMGPSGRGKTTLLNLIGGLDKCTSGAVEVNGKVVSNMSESELAHWRSRNVGFVFQFHNLIAVLNAQQNVEIPLLLMDMAKSERRTRSLNALKIVGLESGREAHYPRELSGGQEQRVAIARAIVADPELLLCDEPTGNLDKKMADEIVSVLQILNKDYGKTILMVTHDSNIIDRCDLVLNMAELDSASGNFKNSEHATVSA